ncbi:hypothetical protein [Aquimarina longa]|uniref:hypothetical protein n=1 Tax=Aquimarina longa TaxID=1080221 RepID=UPI0007810909|nr:hypothetical protein [Aquimarina longa]
MYTQLSDVTFNLDNNTEFTTTFRASEIGTIFFPPFYGKLIKENDTAEQKKEYADFFVLIKVDIPMVSVLCL